MPHLVRVLMLAALLCMAPVAQSAVIEVLIVFDGASFSAAGNRLQEANAIIGNSNQALSTTGLGSAHSFHLAHAYTTAAMPFTSTSSTTDSQMKDLLIGPPTSSVRTQINQLRTQHAADLVVMVNEYLNFDNGDDHCGVTFVAADMPVHISNRNSYFIAVLDRGCVGLPQVPPHELGHLLSAEHELGSGQYADPRPSIPVYDNHPHWTGNLSTVMVSGPDVCPATCAILNAFSDPQASYPGTNPPIARGYAFDRNNKRVISEAFPVVAKYRPEPVPPVTLLAPTCALEFVGCSNGKRRYLVSWYQNDSQPFPVADADYSINGGSTWYDLYGGIDACVPVVPSTPWIVRARIRSSYGDSPFCTIQIQSGSCSGGDL